ncbi:hypothetical protein FAI40_09330 [Acetobacteraceae bacterium]|nr:hypothetical protein FAI40_09330 [Acetobacteraceae bacterium]
MTFNLRFLKTGALFSSIASLSLLSGCYTPVEDLKPTTFGQDQLNRSSEGRLVTILSLMASRARVTNTNKDADGLIGIFESPQLHPQSLVISYQDPNNPQIQSAIEIAKPCEFKTGTAYAVLIDGQTKIQPNNFDECLRIANEKKHKGGKAATRLAEQDAAVPPASPPPAASSAQYAPQQAGSAAPASSNWQNNVTSSPVQQAMRLQSQQNWPKPQTYAND